jgi:hypothetical protein
VLIGMLPPEASAGQDARSDDNIRFRRYHDSHVAARSFRSLPEFKEPCR